MKISLMILDDQEQYCRSLARSLASKYEVSAAHTVAEAMATLSPRHEVMLADIRLDESDDANRSGFDFIRWAREHFPSLPIVAMSALDDPSLEQQAIALGATTFLRKPIVVSQLKALLQQLVSEVE